MQINLHFSSFFGKNRIIRQNTPGILTKNPRGLEEFRQVATTQKGYSNNLINK